MSRSAKRLIIRLSIVSAVIALGVFALISAQHGAGGAKPNDLEQPNPQTGGAGKDVPNHAAGAFTRDEPDGAASLDADPYGLSQLTALKTGRSSSDSQFQPPPSDPTVVRANNDGQIVTSAAATFGSTAGNYLTSTTRQRATGLPSTHSPLTSHSAATDQTDLERGLKPLRSNSTTDDSYLSTADYTGPTDFTPTPTHPGLIATSTDPKHGPTNQRSTERAAPDVADPTYESDSARLDATGGQPSGAPGSFATGAPLGPGQSAPPGRLPSEVGGTSARSTFGSSLSVTSPGYPQPEGIGVIDRLVDLAAAGAASVPGPKELEGVRAPSLILEKRAPPEIQVGKPAMFQLRVANVGSIDADQVVVRDVVPQGTRFVDATPAPTRNTDGSLTWNLGTIEPGNDSTISIQLVPLSEGEIGSVATVSFQTKASVRTVSTKPVLLLEHSGPSQVLIGQSATFEITVTNNGTGVATGVMLEEDVPEQLAHPAGSELEFEIGTLRPGESRQLKLTLQAVKAGVIEHLLMVRGDGNLLTEDRIPFEVTAPQLSLGISGPTRRYLERQATHTLTVANPGTAPATNVELIAFLPKGMQYVNTNNHGQYDPQTHAVYWSLTQLPAKETGSVELTSLPIEMGQHKLRVESRAELGLADTQEQVVDVDGLAAVFFTVADTADPIEVDSDTVYQIQLVNQGSKTATDIRVAASLPAGLRPIGGDGPTTYRIDGQTLVFEPLARLAPKGQAIFKVQARGAQDGDHRVTIQVVSNEVRTPVSKEESTRVYSDR